MKPAARAVLDEVATYTGISVGRMIGRSRTADVVTARWIAISLLLELTDLGRPEIARIFRRHHSTVTHAVVTVADLIAAGQGDELEAGIRICRNCLQGGGQAKAPAVDAMALAELKEILARLSAWMELNGGVA